MVKQQIWRAAASAVLVALVVGALTLPAGASGSIVSRGTFTALTGAAGRPEAPLQGRAQVERVAAGTTRLVVHVSGLQPGVTYGVHLHNLPCSAANPGGGHYKHDAAGVTQPPNELWPSSTPHDALHGITANAAGVASGRGSADWIAGTSAVAVVLHAGVGHGATSTAGGPKLACADLQ